MTYNGWYAIKPKQTLEFKTVEETMYTKLKGGKTLSFRMTSGKGLDLNYDFDKCNRILTTLLLSNFLSTPTRTHSGGYVCQVLPRSSDLKLCLTQIPAGLDCHFQKVPKILS